MARTRIACFLVALLFCMAGLGLSNAQAQNYNLKIQTAVPSSSIYFKLIERMGARVDAMSAGRLKIEVLPAGAVVGVFRDPRRGQHGHRQRRVRLDPLLVR